VTLDLVPNDGSHLPFPEVDALQTGSRYVTIDSPLRASPLRSL
jgi:hypothetical protein